MAARQSLALFDGAMGGVNTMLNVINTKENMADRKYLRDRRLVLDSQADEDRTRNIARQDTADQRAGTLFDQQQRINQYSLANMQGQDRQRRLTESYNLLRAFNSFSDGAEVDPAAVRDSLNYFLSPLLNQGEPVNSRKQIGDIYPDPQNRGVYVELDVTPETGEPYRAPLTMGRSSRDDDPVALVPYEDLFNLVYEVSDDLQDAGFKGTPREITAQLEEFFRVASGDRSVETAAATVAADDRKHRQQLQLKDHETNNQMRLEEFKQQRGIGSSSNSTIQTIEYLRANMTQPDGSPISMEQALEIANLSKSNPRDAVLRVFQTLSDAQASRAFMPGAGNERMSEEQLMEQARQMVQTLDQQLLPTAQNRPRLQQPAAPAPADEGLFDEMPDAAQYPGAEVVDETTGITYRSNGQQWIEVQ